MGSPGARAATLLDTRRFRRAVRGDAGLHSNMVWWALGVASACDRPIAPWVVRLEGAAEAGPEAVRGWLELLERVAVAVPAGCAGDAAPDVVDALGALGRAWRRMGPAGSAVRSTADAFEAARAALVSALPEEASPLRAALDRASLAQLDLLEVGTAPVEVVSRLAAGGVSVNVAIAAVDTLAEPLRSAVRRVQPAAVRIYAGGAVGSGINLDPTGRVLTAAHVVPGPDADVRVEFPDGSTFRAHVETYDRRADVAVLAVSDAALLPSASLAAAPPRVGDPVAMVGQPAVGGGPAHPHRPFHVSSGNLLAIVDDPAADQRLGGVTHDAWTYWGHSGAALLDVHGDVVALHNSWHEGDGTRHAVPWGVLRRVLAR